MGGVFSALSSRSTEPQLKYELAGKMRDLDLGDAHLLPVDDRMSREHGHDLVSVNQMCTKYCAINILLVL